MNNLRYITRRLTMVMILATAVISAVAQVNLRGTVSGPANKPIEFATVRVAGSDIGPVPTLSR